MLKELLKERNLPLPLDRVLYPISLEEQIICFADKFFSKTHLGEEKPLERVKASLAKHGQHNIEQFDEWYERFNQELGMRNEELLRKREQRQTCLNYAERSQESRMKSVIKVIKKE